MDFKRIVLVTGGFDPLHSGHIQYFKRAKELGDVLYVGVNSDEWLTRKKGRPFMPLDERLRIIQELRMVDYTIKFNDNDGSARNAIKLVREMHPKDRIIFANGGDRTQDNIPEMDVNDDLRYKNVEFVFGVGGTDKVNSSSWILEEWKAPKTKRPWGYYRVLHDVPGMKVKELTVNPKSSLSMQKHKKRSEYWIVSEGSCVVNSMTDNGYFLPPTNLNIHEDHYVPVKEWHQLQNISNTPCRIVEIQYGEDCDESDIERQ
jgi:cytidyltransferase-like protein